MKKILVLAASSAAILLSSCYYDPNVSSSFGYNSYGGGGGGYSSSVFVSTGDDRWAYDPYRYSYYDRYRRSYYDPYLNGYYPVGYVPIAVRGAPHPYGWSGRGYCPPPRRINTRNLGRNDDRVSSYAAANYNWSRQVSGSGSSRTLDERGRNDLYSRSRNIERESPRRDDRGGGMRNSIFGSPSAPEARREAPRFDNNRGREMIRGNGIRSLPSRAVTPREQSFRQEVRPELTQRRAEAAAPNIMRRQIREERNVEAPSAPIERPAARTERSAPEGRRMRATNSDEESSRSSGGGLRGLQRPN
jgi:hypothetical protein